MQGSPLCRGRAGDPNWCTVDPSIVTHPGMDGPHIIAALQNGNPPPQPVATSGAEPNAAPPVTGGKIDKQPDPSKKKRGFWGRIFGKGGGG